MIKINVTGQLAARSGVKGSIQRNQENRGLSSTAWKQRCNSHITVQDLWQDRWTAMCLLEDTRESALNDLYRPFGPTTRVFAVTGLNKGFGCVHLVNKEDARREPSTISWIWL
ncbi:hypothetical protein H0E87_019837 [Populus deltoides]|uniref:RRM domain-containing protein n=1 Tax=Populus deltoides TaxID=3696 RepID=A0A8T2XWT8_POPDE|nr:hypothetical protein H0E87_019837 [Populus deltoides]